MRNIIVFLCGICLLLPMSSYAVFVNNVEVPKRVRVDDQALFLQGAAVRTKFVFEVYSAAFYAMQKVSTAQEALTIPGHKRMWFRFTIDMPAKKLQKTFLEGIEQNNSIQVVSQNKKLINNFVDLFDKDILSGDIMTLDYLPGIGTQVCINGKVKATISEAHFYAIVLSTWMGKHPPSQQFQKALLSFN